MKKLISVFIVLLMIGCAQKLTREQALDMYSATEAARIKEYNNLPRETVIDAAVSALNSFDDDYDFKHRPEGFTATRENVAKIELKTTTTDNVTKVDLKIWKLEPETQSGVVFSVGGFGGPRPGLGMGGGVGITEAMTDNKGDHVKKDDYIENPEMYRYFYDRTDFILGLTDIYYDCDNKTYFTKTYMDKDNVLCEYGHNKFPKDAKQPADVIKRYEK